MLPALFVSPNDIQGWSVPVQSIATVVGVPFLAIYVWKTWTIAGETVRSSAATAKAAKATEESARISLDTLKEMRAARDAESAPYVTAHLDIAPNHLVYVEVNNIGKLPARDVSIEFDPPLIARGSKFQPWTLPAFIETTIPFLPPNQHLRSIIGTSIDLLNADAATPIAYRTTIKYKDSSEKHSYEVQYNLDLGVFREGRAGHEMDLGDIERAIKDLARAHEKTADSLASLRDLLANWIAIGRVTTPTRPTYSLDTAKAIVRTELGELHAICRSWLTADELDRYTLIDRLKLRLGVIQSALYRADVRTLPSNLVSEIESLDSILADVIGTQIYADGGRSSRAFAEKVENLAKVISGIGG